MQPHKKQKLNSTSDPFDEEDDWDDDDDILQMVADEVPTFSQMSQVIKATPVDARAACANETAAKSPRSFVFKRPSSSVNSLLNNKPTRYMKEEINDTSLVNSVALESKEMGPPVSSQPSDSVRKHHAHEGEIKWLRSTLKDKEIQINAMRTNFNSEKAKQKLQHSEKERGLVREIESLRSELQFKESELVNIAQSLDRLKREKVKPPHPTVALGSDGFPITVAVKSEPMEVADSIHSASPTAVSLRPLKSNHLTPRKLSGSEFKRKLLVSAALLEKLELVKQSVEDTTSASSGLFKSQSNSSELSPRLLSDCIACSKDLCYI